MLIGRIIKSSFVFLLQTIFTMKKSIIIGLLSLLFSSGHSQNNIGVFSGITASNLTDGFLNDFYLGSNSFSFHFGVVYEMKLNEKFSFRPKIIYTQQGDKETFYDYIQYETTYINTPLNFKFFKNPYLLVGPQIGFLINTKKNYIDFGDLKSFDYGANLGIGLNLKNFFIDFTIYKGFNELIDIELQLDQYNKIDIKATNFTALFSLGYNFQ
jgi:hypothetical protein